MPVGYRYISFRGRHYYAHRLAWLIVKGEWPKNHIDHINGVKDDNRIANLRDVSSAENHRNMKIHRSGKTCGVTRHKASGMFQVCIPADHWLRIPGKSTYHSSHKTLLEASVVSQLLVAEARGLI